MTKQTGTPKKQPIEIMVGKLAQSVQTLGQQFAQLNSDFQTLRQSDEYKTKYLKTLESDLEAAKRQYHQLLAVLFKVIKYGGSDGSVSIPKNLFDLNEPMVGINNKLEGDVFIISLELPDGEPETAEKE